MCVCVCVCVKMKKRVPDEWQALQRKLQAQWKEKYRTGRGPFRQSSHCHPDKRKRERLSTKSTHVTVYLFRDLNRDRSRLLWMTVGPKGQYTAKRRTCKRQSSKMFCVCVFVCLCVCVRVWVCACVCVCVCVTMKKVPDERQARQAIPAILQVSSSKHNAKKITTRVRGPFHQLIAAILNCNEERREAVY